MEDRCSSCPNLYSPVPCEGPEPCGLLFLGEKPGKIENELGIPWCGPAGQELDDTYLGRAGIRRHKIHIGNVYRCFLDNNRSPNVNDIRACAQHFLPRTLRRVKPKFLVLMGGAATKIADEPIRLEMHHGRPQWGTVLGREWEGWIWPTYNPAAGMRDGKQMTALLDDFEKLGKWMAGRWTPPQPDPDELPRDYQYAESIDDLEIYAANCALADVIHPWFGLDTETHGRERWSIQFSLAPGTGRMIRADKHTVVREFADWIEAKRPEMAMHFAVHDLDEMARYQIDLDALARRRLDDLSEFGIRPALYRDTMQEAFQLGNLPQGLKPLVYRLFGYTMTSWEDTVWPASINALTDWMVEALTMAEQGLQEVVKTELKRPRCKDCGHQHSRGPCAKPGCGCERQRDTKVKLDYKAGPAASILRHVMMHTGKTEEDDKPYHPWKKLAEMKAEGLRGKRAEEWEWEWLEEACGALPILGIGNCSSDQALLYAVSDSDWTGRVATELAAIREREADVGGKHWVSEEDRDK